MRSNVARRKKHARRRAKDVLLALPAMCAVATTAAPQALHTVHYRCIALLEILDNLKAFHHNLLKLF